MPEMEPERATRARKHRIVIIVAITLIVEVGLAALVHFGPALAGLVKPVYFIAAAIGVFSVWHALRRHPGHDRRHTDRRGPGRQA